MTQYNGASHPSSPASKPGNSVLGIVGIIIGTIAGAALYLLMSRLGRFSLWSTAVGVFLADKLYEVFSKKNSSPLIIVLNVIVNALFFIMAEIFSLAIEVSAYFSVPLGEVIRELPNLFAEGSFTVGDLKYAWIAVLIIIIMGVILFFRKTKNKDYTARTHSNPYQNNTHSMPTDGRYNYTQASDGTNTTNTSHTEGQNNIQYNNPYNDTYNTNDAKEEDDTRLQ